MNQFLRTPGRMICALVLFSLLTGAFDHANAGKSIRLVIATDRANYQKMGDAVKAMNGQVRFQYKNLDAIAVTIPAEKLTELLSKPEVLRATKDEMVALPAPRTREVPGHGVIAPVYNATAERSEALSADKLQALLNGAPNNYYPFDDKLTRAFDFSALTGHFGENIIVGIIDGGVSSAAIAVAGPGGSRIIGAENFTGDGVPGDSPLNFFHGTAVACCVGANAIFGFGNPVIQNAVKLYAPSSVIPNFFAPGIDGIPMVGQAPFCLFYSLKVFETSGAPTPSSIIAAALDRAIELKDLYNHGAGGVNIRIVNMSLGGPSLFAGKDPIFSPLVKRANDVGMLVTTSAGNSGPAGMTISDPGDSRNILTVGATNDATHDRIIDDLFIVGPGLGALFRPVNNNIVADFSSRGPTADGRSDPDIVAPGTWRYAQGANGGILWASGTSFAAPTVAGAAALLMSAHPGATPDQIRGALLRGANPNLLDDRPKKVDQGFGFLDVLSAHNKFGAFNPIDIGLQTPLVRLNIWPFGLNIIDAKNFSGNTGWLKPGERGEYYVQTTLQPLSGMTVTVNVTAELPPGQQNVFFGDDALVTIASAKTSTGDYRAGAFVAGSQTFTLNEEDLELGFTRVTITGDYTNVGRIRASVSIKKDTSPLNLSLLAFGKVGQGEFKIHTFCVPAAVSQVRVALGWINGWEAWPTNDLDMLILDPDGNPVFVDNDGDQDIDGLSLDVPERVKIAAPAAGNWSVIVLGSTVWKGKADYLLFTDLGSVHQLDKELAVQAEREVPDKFAMEQNYPNPFNPSTVIRYALPVDAHVRLTLYNTVGQEVSSLVDQQELAGFHQVEFRDPGLASGVYFYRIQAGEFVTTKQLVLLK